MLVELKDKEEVKKIVEQYLKHKNISAYKLDKEKIISYKTLKNLLQNPNAKISLTTIITLRNRLSLKKEEKKVIDRILKKYEVKNLSEEVIKEERSSSQDILKIIKKTLKMVRETREVIDDRYVPTNINYQTETEKNDYLSKRKINSFNSDFENNTLLITKIWELNNAVSDKWKEVNLLLNINNKNNNKKIKKGLLTIAANLKEISFKLEEAAFDAEDLSEEEVIIMKEDE